MGALTAARLRLLALFGRVSMYRTVLLALATLLAIALVLSIFGLVAPAPLELLVSAVVLAAAAAATDAIAARVLGRSWRWESTLVTAAILVFVLRPTLDPLGLLGLVLAAVAASASKYLLAWRGRHVLNPAAVGATVLTVVSVWAPALGASAWWVGTSVLAAPVILLGAVVLIRTERVRVVAVFLIVAVAVAFVRASVQYQQAGIEFDSGTVFWQLLLSSPFLFLGAFMLSEPLTLPPRRGQQFIVAGVVGALSGWPIIVGQMSLGQERALLIGNLIAFVFALLAGRGHGVRLTFVQRTALTPTVREVTFRAADSLRFTPGQYLELEVPHSRPDARGTRREFSIVSAPEDLPLVSIALREPTGDAPESSFKRALAVAQPGQAMTATGVWGDFVLPARVDAPALLVAAGIGVTPFVSQLRHAALAGEERDAVLVYVASSADELAFRSALEETGVPVVVFTRDKPQDLPRHWTWASGVRLDAAGLARAVPDLTARHAYVSGPPTLVAELTPALEQARSLTTDAFAGY